MENMEIAWEDFILEEPKTSKSFVQPRTSSRPGSRKDSIDSKISKASGDSNIIFDKSSRTLHREKSKDDSIRDLTGVEKEIDHPKTSTSSEKIAP